MTVKVITAIGTLGDVFPFIALGLALRRRGHRVLLLSNADHAELAAKHGLEFQSIASASPPQNDTTMVRTFRTVVLPSYYRSFAAIRVSASHTPVTVIASDLAIGAIAASEALELPLVRVILSPAGLPDCSRFPVDTACDPHLDITNRYRCSLGLEPIRCSRGIPSDRRILNVCMFPRNFVPPERTANVGVFYAGFPFLNMSASEPDATMDSFIDRKGPPIVCTPGTGVVDSEPMIRAAHLLQSATGYPVIFLSRHLTPNDLIECDNILFASFTDLTHLLARARLLFHHGGIGTLAQGVRAGIPQIIAPTRFDQPINARIAEALGLAISFDCSITSLPALRAIVKRAVALAKVHGSMLVRVASEVRAVDGAEVTAELLGTMPFDLKGAT